MVLLSSACPVALLAAPLACLERGGIAFFVDHMQSSSTLVSFWCSPVDSDGQLNGKHGADSSSIRRTPTCAAPATVSKRMTSVMQSVFITTVPLAWEGQIDSLVSPDTGQSRWESRTEWFGGYPNFDVAASFRAPFWSRLRGSWRGVRYFVAHENQMPSRRMLALADARHLY